MNAIKCSLCDCVPERCEGEYVADCINCTSSSCCCAEIHKKIKRRSAFEFLKRLKIIFPIALGIEILCLSAAELGENVGLFLLGYNAAGIALALVLGFAFAGITTFFTILGRSSKEGIIINCSAFDNKKGFYDAFIVTLQSFVLGITKFKKASQSENFHKIVLSSLYVLFTAEFVCILTAEFVGIILYPISPILAVPIALFFGALSIAIIQSVRTKR